MQKQNKTKQKGWGGAHVVESLPSMCKALSSNPSARKDNRLSPHPAMSKSLTRASP
jgi:hypothetical protein